MYNAQELKLVLMNVFIATGEFIITAILLIDVFNCIVLEVVHNLL